MDKQEFIENMNKAGLRGEEVCRELEAEISRQEAEGFEMESLAEVLKECRRSADVLAGAIVWTRSSLGLDHWYRIYKTLRAYNL